LARTKFTDAPWGIDSDGLAVISNKFGVCTVSPEVAYWGDSVDFPPFDEVDANLRLISAAPELFDLVINARRYIHEFGKHHIDNWQDVVADIDAVLMKVYGEQEVN
jgi:hypothetical protein